MNENKVYTAIGVMCGTSMDAIDLALVKTNGADICELLEFRSIDNDDAYKEAVRKVFKRTEVDNDVLFAQKIVTDTHIKAIQSTAWEADLIGFHGQTITHMPEDSFTWQIGDNQRLADELGIDVVGDLRQADIKAGGQGAPLMPICHQVFLKTKERPVVILNMGGVSNITWLGHKPTDILAGDVGPANALIDDYMNTKLGKSFDEGGKLASSGTINQDLLDTWLSDDFFKKPLPKSLDRDPWDVSAAYDLSIEDGAATITAFTIESILHSLSQVPEKPEIIYVGGGGRQNRFIMSELQRRSGITVESVEKIGWNGDALEAKGFAYMAVRSLLGLVITMPTTTGVSEPMTGGVLYSSSDMRALRPAMNK